MSTVLVTGGAGFIGSHTVDVLVSEGHQVRVFDSLQERVHPFGQPGWLNSGATFMRGDVTDPQGLTDALTGVDYVCHLAAYQDHQSDYDAFIHTNTESLARIFSLIKRDPIRHPVRHVLYASSQAACGEGRYICPGGHRFWPRPRSKRQLESGRWEHGCPVCESIASPEPMDVASCSAPTTAYGVSKLAMESLAHALGPRLGVATTGLRYTHVLGTRNSVHNAYSGLVRRSMMLLQRGEAPRLYEDGQQLCDVVDVRDVARANVMLLTAFVDDSPRVFNVGGAPDTTVADIATLLCEACGVSVRPRETGTFRYGDPRHMISDSEPLHRLGWSPKISLRETLQSYVEWFSRQPQSGTAFDQAERDMIREGVVRR